LSWALDEFGHDVTQPGDPFRVDVLRDVDSSPAEAGYILDSFDFGAQALVPLLILHCQIDLPEDSDSTEQNDETSRHLQWTIHETVHHANEPRTRVLVDHVMMA
jgi:hypothetical protein